MTESALEPIEYRTLNHIVTDQLREAILSGRLPPGTALNQRDIADQLSVSRMPVREAFRTLELEGLIRGLPRRKAVVVSLQAEDLADIFDILATLEARAAEKAAPRFTDEELARLSQLHDRLGGSNGDVGEALDLDLAFHATIHQTAGGRMPLIIQSHRNAVRPYLPAGAFQRDRWSAMQDEHGQIVAALEARDAAATRRAMAAHLRSEGRALVDHLRRTQEAAA